MEVLGRILVGLVAALHLWFMTLEMFLFRKPLGLSTFHISQQSADTCVTLAMNQGLYNGFLAAALITALVTKSMLMRRYGLLCVMVAGIFGAGSLGDKAVLVAQTLPAMLALILTELGSRRQPASEQAAS